MKKIYVAGSIRGVQNESEEIQQTIVYLQKKYIVLTEHLFTEQEQQNRNMSDSHIFEEDTKWIRESDFVIAFVSAPSHGVGYELAYAEQLQKPILCLHKKGNKLSAMIQGNKSFIVRNYENITDCIAHVGEFLGE